MQYLDVIKNAKELTGFKCKVCRDCNGIACRGELPGVGGKGTGASFIRNREKINEIKVNLDTIIGEASIDTSIELFGRKFRLPVFAAPIGALTINYGEQHNDLSYAKAVVEGCINAGTLAFTGDGAKDEFFDSPLQIIDENNGMGIPTIKPWKNPEILKKIKRAEEKKAVAVAIDIDAAGLILLKLQGKPVATKSVEELKELVASTQLPIILKGIMTPEGANKALEAGVYGIVVSNHGGRVMDHTAATIEVLPSIVAAVKGKLKIFIDGGFRNGIDVFKALALGADAVLIGRPFGISVYGGGVEGVTLYTQKLQQELEETMIMTGCHSLKDINRSHVFI